MTKMIRKLKGRRILSGRKGFTLVEVIVTLVITVAVIAVSSSLVITGTNIFARSAQRDIQANIAETVLSFVSDQLLYTEYITNLDTNPPVLSTAGGNAILMIKKNPSDTYTDVRGQLFFRRANDSQNPVNVFGSNFYNNYKIGLTVEIKSTATGYSMTLTARVYNSADVEVLSRTTVRSLLNYHGPAQTLPLDGEGFCIYFNPLVLS